MTASANWRPATDLQHDLVDAADLRAQASRVAGELNLGPRGNEVLHAYRILLEERRTRALEAIADTIRSVPGGGALTVSSHDPPF